MKRESGDTPVIGPSDSTFRGDWRGAPLPRGEDESHHIILYPETRVLYGSSLRDDRSPGGSSEGRPPQRGGLITKMIPLCRGVDVFLDDLEHLNFRYFCP